MKLKFVVLFLFQVLTHTVFAQKAKVEYLSNLPYDKYELNTGRDTITFYLSVSQTRSNLPLIVFVQGSGMNSLFTKSASGEIRPEYGHMSWYTAGKEKYRVLIVEKPGVRYLQSGPSKIFDKKFSLESFSSAIVDAVNYVLKNEKIDTGRVLVAGHSEGGIVAARVAGMMEAKITSVAIMAGEGLSQLYSLYKFADDGTFFNTKEHDMPTAAQRIHYLTDTWKDILSDPENTDKKFWGFTYLRWSSMLKTSVINELADYNGRILIAQGTEDKAVYPETAIAAYTSFLSKGKDVELKLIEQADHSFNIRGKPKASDGWLSVIEKTIVWFNK
jgi:predicted esterase